MRIKLKDNFKLTDIAGDAMLIPVGEDTYAFGGYVALNETAAFLIRQMSESIDEQELTARLLDAYEVDEQTAAESVAETVQKLRELGVVEVSAE